MNISFLKREMKPSLRMLMIEAGIKRLIPQIVSVGKRKLPECPFLAEVQRLGDSKYQGEGVHTELYFSQKQPRALRKMLIHKYSLYYIGRVIDVMLLFEHLINISK